MESKNLTRLLLIGGLIWFVIFLMHYNVNNYFLSLMYLLSSVTWLTCSVANYIINKKK